MTTLVKTIRRIRRVDAVNLTASFYRGIPLVVMFALVSVIPGFWETALESLSEAYLAVSIFVAGTLTLVFAAERGFKTSLGAWLRQNSRWQVLAGAVLGAFPGCGGAIVAITQYTRGYMSFGAVVATLTSTMGDAMFLLLAREPVTAFGILILGIIVGAISGYIVDKIHGQQFMRPKLNVTDQHDDVAKRSWMPKDMSMREKLWIAIMVPGFVVGLMAAFQIDLDELFPGSPAMLLGVIGAVLATLMWVRSGDTMTGKPCSPDKTCSIHQKPIIRSVINDTNFITSWVVFAFVGYEIALALMGFDLADTLAVWAPLIPAMAVMIGFIPGCGPPIMITSLYLAGQLPLSAQLGNAISNDGDALFPAIAVAPKAALVATLYSAIPAVIVAYGWYWIYE